LQLKSTNGIISLPLNAIVLMSPIFNSKSPFTQIEY